MKKVSAKKLSILGLVLMAASAVTAAMLPSQSNLIPPPNSADDGTLRQQSGGGASDPNGGVLSCVADAQDGEDDVTRSCHLTNLSLTGNGTVSGQSSANGVRTAGNTSMSDGIQLDNDDTSSVAP